MCTRKEIARLGRGILALGMLFCAIGQANAQSQSANLIGLATDESGAALPAVDVQVRNVATGLTRSVQSTADGTYTIALLPAGEYRVRAQKSGFRVAERTGVMLAADSTVRIDFRLIIGEVTETVEVAAGGQVPFDTETGRLNLTIPERKILDLPYNQLGTLNLARYIPGAFSMSGSFEWSVAGLGNTQINQSFDGITVNNMNGGLGGGYYFSPSLDAVREVSYTVVNQSAENPFAATYSVVSKSGSNQVAGSFWWYLSHPEWNARDYFATTSPTGDLNHRVGGTLGGPILRNRTFFFADVQQERNTVPRQYNLLVPTDKLRGGDFSGLGTVRDPLTNELFPGNRIPVDRIPDAVRNMMDFYLPQPNVARDENFGFFNETVNRNTRLQHYNIRVDHKFSNTSNLMARVLRQTFTDYNNLSAPVPVWGEIKRLNPTWGASASHTWVLSPRLLNEARIGWSLAPDESSGDLDGAAAVQQLGLTGYDITLPHVATAPALSITGLSSIGSPRVPIREDRVWHISNSLTWMAGRHTVKAGTLIRPMTLNQQLPELQDVFGSLDFTGTYTGLGMGDFLLGLPETTSRIARAYDTSREITQVHWFVQDDFRLSETLTLNLGLRFERNPEAIEDTFNLVSIFDPATGSIVVPTDQQRELLDPRVRALVPVLLASDVGFDEKGIIDQRNKHWYPRVGVAWRPFGDARTVVRAGYGVYATDNANLFSAIGGGLYAVSETFDNTIGPNGPLFQLPQVFPAGGGTQPIAPGALSVSTQQRGRPVAYSQQWNVSFEHELRPNLSMRLSYQGNRNTNLGVYSNLNQPTASTDPFDQSRRPYPLYRDIPIAEFRGSSSFNGLTAALSKRFSSGFLFDVTYSVQRDVGDAFTYFGGQNEDRYNFARDRGNTPYIPRQRFTAQYIWELPFGRDRHFGADWNGLLQWVAGGWQVSGFFAAQSGLFFTPTFSGVDTSNTQRFGGRADAIGDGTLSGDERTIERWFDAAAYAIPANGTFGNVKPFSLEGPGRWVMDFGVYKEFGPWAGHQRLRFQATFINLFNHPAFGLPVADITSPAVGQILSTDNTEGGGGRTVQLGLRYTF
ncbi:MAG: hypothetical protein GEV06_24495 [Luteitalea sp.]|nr:hypothetical protein [Luteitalea sp.]